MGKLFRKWEHGGRAKIGVLPTQLPLSKSRRMPHPPRAPPRHHVRVMEWTAPTNAIYKDGVSPQLSLVIVFLGSCSILGEKHLSSLNTSKAYQSFQ